MLRILLEKRKKACNSCKGQCPFEFAGKYLAWTMDALAFLFLLFILHVTGIFVLA